VAFQSLPEFIYVRWAYMCGRIPPDGLVGVAVFPETFHDELIIVTLFYVVEPETFKVDTM
jgi:hypothetical protein